MAWTASLRSPRGGLPFLLCTAFLNALGTRLVNPVVPFLVARFAPGTDRVGLWVSGLSFAYAVPAFLAGPVLGALGDAVGRRPALLFSVLGSAAGYWLFGAASALLGGFIYSEVHAAAPFALAAVSVGASAWGRGGGLRERKWPE